MNDELTIFVIKFGNNPNFDDCMEALNKQTVKANIEIIKDYAPLSVAFQEMLNRCQTPYYIEVDEDMILKPNAIELLLASIKSSGKKIAMVCYKLLDAHLNFEIFGVKIYKYDILKKYPYNLETISCEVDQLKRMEKDHYIYRLFNQVIGIHSPKWTNELIFERYYDLMNKYKKYGYTWLREVPNKLLEMFTASPTQFNLFALLGVFSSILSEDFNNKEKSFVQKNKAFLRVKSWTSFPNRATLYMTNKCNFKCSFCLRSSGMIEDAPDIDIHLTQKMLDKFPTIKSVCICGFGEPFMSPNLRFVIQHLKKKNIFIGLITNGSLLIKNMWWLKTDTPNYISVSLNASNQELHAKETGVDGMFANVIKGIKALVTSGIPTYLSYVCTKDNIKHVPEFLKLAKSLDVKGVHLHNLLPHNISNEKDKKWFLKSVLTDKDIALIESIKSLPEADIVEKYPILISIEKPIRNCNFPWDSIAIDGNGSITICNSVIPTRKIHGNITDSIVWHNDYCEKFRQLFSENLPFECKYCFRNWEN